MPSGPSHSRGSPADDGEGLPASSDVASATTTVEAAPAPVVREDAGLVVRGKDNGKKDDKIVARAQVKTAGGTVTLYKKTSNGLKKLMHRRP